MGKKDLDSSLDDIIKKRQRTETKSHNSRNNNSNDARNLNVTARRNTVKNNLVRNNGRGIQKNSKSSINSRLGDIVISRKPFHQQAKAVNKEITPIQKQRPKIIGPIITSAYKGESTDDNRRKKKEQAINPATLIITRSVTPTNNKTQNKTKSSQPYNSNDNTNTAHSQKSRQPKQLIRSAGPPVTVMNPVYHQQKPMTPPEQTGIVLLCNLDPRATAEDVGETCSMFGPILSCDMLLDPIGRPLHEAEVEFMYPHSAQECALKLDGEIADGRVLRARLQYRPTPPVMPRYSSRTVGASARVEPRFNDTQL